MTAVIIGAGVGGLCAALAFRRHGWDVELLDADDDPGPATHDRETIWFRRGTPHARQAHAFNGGFIKALHDVSPTTLDALIASGVVYRDADRLRPQSLSDAATAAGDEEIRSIGARRPHGEWSLRRAVLADPRIRLRFGAHVRGLDVRPGPGTPHVRGVRLDDGEVVQADVVIDASGRRSKAPAWLRDAGVVLPESQAEPCNMVYWTRYYRLLDPAEEAAPGGGVVLAVAGPTFNRLMFAGDNGTLQVAMGTLPNDAMFASARRPEVFHAVVCTAPAFAAWLDPDRSEPITDVGVYGGLDNRLQFLVADGEPVVTGFHLVGDAGAITNPQYGRGLSHAAVHAAAVAAIATRIQEPRAQALTVHAEVARMIEPSVKDSIMFDRQRTAWWLATLRGRDAPDGLDGYFPRGVTSRHHLAGWSQDPVVWRALIRCAFVLDPPGSWRHNEEVVERLRALEPVAVPNLDERRAELARVAEAIASV